VLIVEPTRWFGSILFITALAALFAVVISGDSPVFLVRYVFGFIFVAILPGYCLVNLLFVKENRLDFVENVVLSVALSFGLAGLMGLFLGLSPIGINFNSITISLSALVVILAFFAFLRKRKLESRESQVQSPNSVG
jgi:uncharacterized membrane protein